MSKIPVGRSIEYAYAFTFGNIATLFGLAWFAFAVIIVPQFLLRSWVVNVLFGGAATGQVGARVLLFLFSIFGWLAIAMTKVAFLRQALGLRTGGAVFYFSLGAPVWRVIGAYLLVALAFAVAYVAGLIAFLIAGIVVGLVLGGVIGATGAPLAIQTGVGIAIAVLIPVLLCALLYVLLRLGFFVATIVVAEGRIDIKRGWHLTKGNFWRMLGVVAAVDLPIYVLYFLILLSALDFNVLPPLHAGVTPVEINAWARDLTLRINGAWMIVVPSYFLVFVISTGLSAASTAYAYRTLQPREDIAAHFA